MKKRLISILAFLAVSVSAFCAPNADSIESELLKFDQFYHILNRTYVDTLDNNKLVEEAIKAVLAELDPHSSYSSAEEMKSISESFEGSFSGIGIEFDILKDTLIVVNTITGGPAERVGVMANDKIVEIDGESSIGILRNSVPKLLRGPKGTVVEIGVLRKGVDEVLHFRITRDNIPIHTVDASYKIDDKIGYIRVNRFAENTMSEFREAYAKFGKVDGMILDLRGNGGGLLDQAIMMSEFFLPSGSLIVSTEGRAVSNSSHKSRRNGAFINKPLVVMIDSGSASGSEIVAGAIQDWDRGVIVGQPSFGKGLVQRQVFLRDGSAVRITVARYHTPTGRVIQRPYEQGKAEDYYLDHLMRSYDTQYADSVNSSAPTYKTLKYGREVAGGGGISPDIYIARDTTKNFSYWNQLVRAGLINSFANTYLDENRKELEAKYPTFEKFNAEFAIDAEMMAALIVLGEANGIEYSEAVAASSREDIELHIKALIAQKLWSTSEYFMIINSADDAFNRSVDIIKNWDTESQILKK